MTKVWKEKIVGCSYNNQDINLTKLVYKIRFLT